MRCLQVALLLVLPLCSATAYALSPCLPNPCLVEGGQKCEGLSDWVAEGTLVEIRYRSEEIPNTFPMELHTYQSVIREMVFLPDKTIKGSPLQGEVSFTPLSVCWAAPKLEDMRPVRLRVFTKRSERGIQLIHFERIPKMLPNPSINTDAAR
jgi:hypothetical protein